MSARCDLEQSAPTGSGAKMAGAAGDGSQKNVRRKNLVVQAVQRTGGCIMGLIGGTKMEILAKWSSMLPSTIPIFPLPNVVLFPNVFLPLHIFETRYRAMVATPWKGTASSAS